VVHSSRIALEDSGAYSDPCAPVGTYDIACTFKPTWLRQVICGVTVAPSGFAVSFTPPNGDINLDGLIGFSDLIPILVNYNKRGTWPNGDLTWDGWIGFTDLVVVLTSFGMVAEE
jgi:hypothetical protein